MPLDWVPNERYLEHNGVEIFHVYKDDLAQSGTRTYWFGLSDYASDDDDYGLTFDVRDLSTAKDYDTETEDGRQAAIRAAIELGELPPP